MELNYADNTLTYSLGTIYLPGSTHQFRYTPLYFLQLQKVGEKQTKLKSSCFHDFDIPLPILADC